MASAVLESPSSASAETLPVVIRIRRATPLTLPTFRDGVKVGVPSGLVDVDALDILDVGVEAHRVLPHLPGISPAPSASHFPAMKFWQRMVSGTALSFRLGSGQLASHHKGPSARKRAVAGGGDRPSFDRRPPRVR